MPINVMISVVIIQLAVFQALEQCFQTVVVETMQIQDIGAKRQRLLVLSQIKSSTPDTPPNNPAPGCDRPLRLNPHNTAIYTSLPMFSSMPNKVAASSALEFSPCRKSPTRQNRNLLWH